MSNKSNLKELTREEWEAEGEARFGKDKMQWKFVCPSCSHVASVQDYKDAGAPEGTVAFSCIGRWVEAKGEIFDKKGGPCNYAGGGLFQLNPVKVDGTRIFEFADAEKE